MRRLRRLLQCSVLGIACALTLGGCSSEQPQGVTLPPAVARPFLLYTERTPDGGWQVVEYFPDTDQSVTVATSRAGEGPVVPRLTPFGSGSFTSMDIYRPGTPPEPVRDPARVPRVVYLDRDTGQQLDPLPELQLGDQRRALLDLVGDRALVAVHDDQKASAHQDLLGDLLLYRGRHLQNLGRACVDYARTASGFRWFALTPDRERVQWFRPINEGETEPTKYDIWVTNLPAGKSRRVASFTGSCLQGWLPDGRTLLYLPYRTPMWRAVDADTGEEVPGPPKGRIAISPDGGFWAVVANRSAPWVSDPSEILRAPGRGAGAGGDYVSTPWARRGDKVWYLFVPTHEPEQPGQLVLVTPETRIDLPVEHRLGWYALLSAEGDGRLVFVQGVDYPNPDRGQPRSHGELVLMDFSGRTVGKARGGVSGPGMLRPHDGGIVFVADQAEQSAGGQTELRRMDVETGRTEPLYVFDRPVELQRLGEAFLAFAQYRSPTGRGYHQRWYVSRDGARTWRILVEGDGLELRPVNGERPREAW